MGSKLSQPNLALLRDVLFQDDYVYIGSDSIDIRFQTKLLEVSDGSVVILNKVPPELVTQFAKGTKYYLQVRMLRLQTTQFVPTGLGARFAIQDNSVISETRAEERFFFSSHENVTCEILNPIDQKTTLQRPVLDMSSSGLSLRCLSDSKLFQPGRIFPSLRVIIEKKPYNHVSGEVVYVRKLMDFQGVMSGQVGLRIHGPAKD